VDLLRAGDLARLKVCRASGCDHVLVDLTRNRSRHFCGSGCADRTHAAAYRARQAGDAG
jgi:predicted RNA-binding Zn ribbon-like protein